MNSIYLSFDGVGSGGWEAIPKAGPGSPWDYKVLQCHYDNRDMFGALGEMLLIETARSPQGGILVYYQYLRYKGVEDRSGRHGSAFGVTIATDTFCPDYEMMFSLCRDIFDKCVAGGRLLTADSDGRTKWMCDSLTGAGATLESAESKLVKVLTAYHDTGMLTDMPVTGWSVSQSLNLNNKAQTLVSMNPSDVTGASLMSLLKTGKKVAVCNQFPPKVAEQAVAAAERSRLQAETTAASLSSQLEEARSGNSVLTAKLKELNDEKTVLGKKLAEATTSTGKKENGLKMHIQELQKQLEDKDAKHEAQLRKYKAEGNYSCQDQLDRINAKLSHMAEAGGKKHADNSMPMLKHLLIGGAIALAVAVLGFFIGRLTVGKDKEQNTEKKEEPQEQTEKTLPQKEEHEMPFGKGDDSFESDEEFTTDAPRHNPNTRTYNPGQPSHSEQTDIDKDRDHMQGEQP